MKRIILVFFLLFFFCAHGRTENLNDALESALSNLPLQEWQAAYDQAFPQGEDFHTLILRLARGKCTWMRKRCCVPSPPAS